MTRELVKGLTFRKPQSSFDGKNFLEFVEKQYLKSNKSGNKRKETFSPSNIGGYNGLCPRYWYLAFKGTKFTDSTDAMGIANMANGTAAHTRIERLLQDSGIPVDVEIEIKLDSPPIRGYVDMMLEWEGEVVVGEFKTARQEVFGIRQATSKPSAQHLIQLLIYLKATNKNSGFILYENKNTNELLVIPVVMNDRYEKIIEDVFEWMRLVYKNYEEGELPERPFTKRSAQCKNCPVWDTCWTGEKGTVVIPPMEVPKVI